MQRLRILDKYSKYQTRVATNTKLTLFNIEHQLFYIKNDIYEIKGYYY